MIQKEAVPKAAMLVERAGAPVTFFNVNTKETETFVLPYDGVLGQADLKRITHLFRCKRTNHEQAPDPGLLKILARVAEHYPDHVFEVVSAHRHNRGTSRTSKHWSAHAIDLRVHGVSATSVRSYVWKMEEPIGLGFYRQQQFVHIDWRAGEEKIGWDQRHEGSVYHYWPRWTGGDPHKKKTAKAKQRPSRHHALRSAQPQS